MRQSDQSDNGGREEDRRAIDLHRADPQDIAGKRAISELLSRYADRVYSLCLRYAGDHDRAMDLAQDSLIQAYRKLDSLSDESKFRSWLFAITRNRCLSEFRKVDLLKECAVDPDALISSAPGPEQRLEEEMDLAVLEDLMLRHLEEREQEAIYLRCFERMSVDAITATMGITESSGARGLLQRARRKLRAAMQAPEWEEGRNA